MAWVKPGAEFAELLASFERSAWRWECQGTYREPDEREPLQAWRNGRPDYSFMDPWLDQIRRQRAEGKRFERVRLLTDPPTEYLRWLFGFTHLNVDAGEDIRWIGERQARELDAPSYDFYLLDDLKVAVLHFDENGVSGAELTDHPDTVAEHRRWRDRVWPVAVPHDMQFEPTTRSP
ncbi:DUF6879 family protein [Amycolatopsis eburnea]|uniref:DUF6879 domain-containing protein n=1 Tax=Amycolatopsis eburnea TaxID=2267691 RepID=A0A3R9KPU9_9PSEU|nr:DUF6879 family protein [Amycolatopsis eburnea]RSD22023.1 hypothetical protein EIY87_09415 [Amycolatopsis eburnea]